MKYNYTHKDYFLNMELFFLNTEPAVSTEFWMSETGEFGKRCQQDSLNSQFNWFKSGAGEQPLQAWRKRQAGKAVHEAKRQPCRSAVALASQLSQSGASFSDSRRWNIPNGF